jgi:hypothetical protein|tara:strand:+ start:1828 stop:2109 length:282 start_codon:yes stop_codon:yes gene_type:complete
MIVAIIILGVFVVGLGFTTINLLRKNEKQEDILVGYLQYLDKISQIIEFTDKKLKEIDSKETFKSDDEVGFFFEELQRLQTILNEFKVENLEK